MISRALTLLTDFDAREVNDIDYWKSTCRSMIDTAIVKMEGYQKDVDKALG
jgi:hypothetical protein